MGLALSGNGNKISGIQVSYTLLALRHLNHVLIIYADCAVKTLPYSQINVRNIMAGFVPQQYDCVECYIMVSVELYPTMMSQWLHIIDWLAHYQDAVTKWDIVSISQ